MTMRRWVLRAGNLLVVWIYNVLNLLMIAPQPRAVVKSVLFVTQLLPLPVKPQLWVTPDPVRESVTFPLPNGEGSADIYRTPGCKKRAALTVVVGVHRAPKDDPRVVNLGNTLARAGFVAMFPWSPSLMEMRLDPAEPDHLVWAFKYLWGLDYVDPNRVGMGGFCVGASIALTAASDPRISEDVNFVGSFGAYFDMRDLLRQLSTNSRFYRGTVEPWHPSNNTQAVFTQRLVEAVDDEEERQILTRLFVEKTAAASLTTDQLSTAAQVVSKLLSSLAAEEEGSRLTLEEAATLISNLPSGTLEDLDSVSPSIHIGNLKARVLIAHDREDDAVPSEESRRLADSLASRGRFTHTEFSFFSHVTPGKHVGPFGFMKEAFKLFRYTYGIIRVAA